MYSKVALIHLRLFTTRSLGLGNFIQYIRYSIRQKKKNCYVALSRPTVKCEKTGSGFFFFFFMSDLGEEFAKICIQWLKKALA